jgi:hypothetical protein
MKITEAQLQSFIELYKKELSISLSPVDAQAKALSLLRFLAISVIAFDSFTEDDTI